MSNDDPNVLPHLERDSFVLKPSHMTESEQVVVVREAFRHEMLSKLLWNGRKWTEMQGNKAIRWFFVVFLKTFGLEQQRKRLEISGFDDFQVQNLGCQGHYVFDVLSEGQLQGSSCSAAEILGIPEVFDLFRASNAAFLLLFALNLHFSLLRGLKN